MNRLLNILKSQYKILLVWLLAAVVPIVAALATLFQSDTKMEQLHNMKQSYEILNLIKDVKHFIKHDLLIASEIIHAEDDHKIDELWEQHTGMADEIRDLTNYLSSLSSEMVVDTGYYKEKQIVVVAVKTIVTVYNDKILSDYRLLFEHSKNNEQQFDNSESDMGEFMLFGNDDETDEQNKLLIYQNLKKEATTCFRLLIQIEELSSELQETNDAIISEYTQTQSSVQIIVTTVFLLLSLFVALFIYHNQKEKVIKITQAIDTIVKGTIPKLKPTSGSDEYADLKQSVVALSKEMQNLIAYATHIQEGNYNTTEVPFSGDGEVTKAIEAMTKSLKKLDSHQKSVAEEEKKNDWTAKGVALFADILRGNDSNINTLSDTIIRSLVKYIKATQGAIYLVEENKEEDAHFRLNACIAYNQKRNAKKQIALNEGLLGRCYYERKSIYLKELPEDYIKIKSGLGEKLPRNIILTPLIYDNVMVGIIELASFSIFKPYEMEFLVSLGEDIAQTIINAKNIARTAALLEQTKLQTEELISQEEELRQNMEEMRATQEEASRKEKLSIGFANTVNHTLIRADFDKYGRLLYGNSMFFAAIGLSEKEAQGHDISFMVMKNETSRIGKVIEDLAAGGRHFEGIVNFANNNKQVALLTTLTAVKDDYGIIEKILLLAFNTETINK